MGVVVGGHDATNFSHRSKDAQKNDVKMILRDLTEMLYFKLGQPR